MPFDPLNSHKRWPPYLNKLDGHTGELPSGIRVGQLAEAVYNHCCNWRFQGPALYTPHQTSTIAKNDSSGTYHIITHYPENRAGQDRRLALFWAKHGIPVAAAYSIDFVDPNDGGNDVTLESGVLAATTYPLTTPERHQAVVEYAETVNANGFDVVHLGTINTVLAYLKGVHVPLAAIDENQLIPKPEDLAPDEIIAYLDRSFRGLMERIYNEGDLVFDETVERVTRRVFFNWCMSSYTVGANEAAYKNVFTELKFPAECRDLLKTQGTRYCYPAAVIDVDDDAGAEVVRLRFRSLITGNVWTYTYQNGVDPVLGNPFLITFDRVGASNVLGLQVVVENDAVFTAGDLIVVEGQAPNRAELRVHAAGLWEGPP